MDQNGILILVGIASLALVVGFICFAVVGHKAFANTTKGSATSFTRLLQRGGALKLLLVFMAILAISVLALAGKIDGSAVFALIGSIVGYVVGGIDRSSSSQSRSEIKSDEKD